MSIVSPTDSSLLFGSFGFLLYARPCLHNAVSNRKCVRDIVKAVPQCIQWEENPEHVEEHQVDPEEHEVAAVEVLVAGEPFGGEGHKTW